MFEYLQVAAQAPRAPPGSIAALVDNSEITTLTTTTAPPPGPHAGHAPGCTCHLRTTEFKDMDVVATRATICGMSVLDLVAVFVDTGCCVGLGSSSLR